MVARAMIRIASADLGETAVFASAESTHSTSTTLAAALATLIATRDRILLTHPFQRKSADALPHLQETTKNPASAEAQRSLHIFDNRRIPKRQ